MLKKNAVNSKSKKKDKSFEDSLKRLEKIVDEMENADPGLDKALELFTEGVELVRFCSSKINEAKRRVEILVKDNVRIRKENFENEEEEN